MKLVHLVLVVVAALVAGTAALWIFVLASLIGDSREQPGVHAAIEERCAKAGGQLMVGGTPRTGLWCVMRAHPADTASPQARH